MESASTPAVQESSSPYGALTGRDGIVVRVRRFKPAMNRLSEVERQELLGEALEIIREGNLGARDALRG